MKSKIIFALLILNLNNTFAQDNPYEVFGHTSKVVYETKVTEYLTVKNSNSSSKIKSIAFNFEDRVILFLGDKDTILKTLKIEPEQLLRFLSVDPLTKDYPWYTPYQFAGNKPIMAIDLDGLEEFVKIFLPDGGTGYNYIKTINYSDLYPGQKYGPLGKAGTASVLFKTYADDKKSFSEAKVQISYLDNNNQRIFKEGIFDFGKTLGAYTKFANSIQGGSDPANEGAKIPDNGSVALGVSGVGSYGVGASVSFAWDKKGGKALQFNTEQALGYEAPGINLTFTEYTPVDGKNFSVSDYKDASTNNTIGVFIFSLSKGENYDKTNNKKGNIYSSKSFGLNIGMDSAIPVSAKHSESNTYQKEFKGK
jgi:hypothetical protein